MEKLQPSSLVGPRTYFIDFDPRRTRNIRDRRAWKTHVLRRIKTLLLAKRSVVCAASHLRSPLVYDFLRENPCLLEQGLLIPALRSDMQGVLDYVTSRRPLAREMRAFYADTIQEVVCWIHEPNATRFRDSLVHALKDDKSLLRVNIHGVPSQVLMDIAGRLRNTDLLTRGLLHGIIAPLETPLRRSLGRFADLVYYCSGARAVNCETAISETCYVDFSIPALLGKQSSLSEEAIFWKIFVEQTLESLNLPAIPWESLDLLSLPEIIEARTPILEAGFCERYDAMLKQAMEPVGNTLIQLALSAEILLKLRDTIASSVRSVVLSQREAFIAGQERRMRGRALRSSTALGIGLLGMLPVVGAGFGAVGSAMAGRELCLTIQEARRTSDATKARQLAIKKVISASDFQDKSILYDMVRYLGNIIGAGLWT